MGSASPGRQKSLLPETCEKLSSCVPRDSCGFWEAVLKAEGTGEGIRGDSLGWIDACKSHACCSCRSLSVRFQCNDRGVHSHALLLTLGLGATRQRLKTAKTGQRLTVFLSTLT